MDLLAVSTPFRTLYLLLAVLSFSACGPSEPELTEAEKAQRQDLAPDLSGDYVSENEGEHPTFLSVTNETKTHDIRVSFQLGRGLTPSEENKIVEGLRRMEHRYEDQEIDIIITKLSKSLQKLTLGSGAQNKSRGGENVALDTKGEVSEVAIYHNYQNFYETQRTGLTERYMFSSSLFFTAESESGALHYYTTSNTDKDGQSMNKDKGFYISLARKTTDSAGRKVNHKVFCTLKLSLSEFARK